MNQSGESAVLHLPLVNIEEINPRSVEVFHEIHTSSFQHPLEM